MKNMYKGGTEKTPEIFFDAKKGLFRIKGRSIPENSIEFYKPFMEWLDKYAEPPGKKTTVDIQLEYFNTSSSKCILDIFKKLERLNNANVSINWHYESDDEDMIEAGEDYQSLIDIPFNMIEIEI
ncbi:MAG: DUF1987 domain-containing protein [Bacteroidota bacterium]|nr:DUF1987 domain-containing protein [Bacteroidota bacterium]